MLPSNDLTGLVQLLSHGLGPDGPSRQLHQQFVLRSAEEYPFLTAPLIQACVQAITAHPTWQASEELQQLCRGPDEASLSQVSLAHVHRPFHSGEALRAYQYLAQLLDRLPKHPDPPLGDPQPTSATTVELEAELFKLQQLNEAATHQLQQRQHQFDAQVAAAAAANYTYEPSIFVTTPMLLNRPLLSSIPPSPVFSPQLMPSPEHPDPPTHSLSDHPHHHSLHLLTTPNAPASVADPSQHDLHFGSSTGDIHMSSLSASSVAEPSARTDAEKMSQLTMSQLVRIWSSEPVEEEATPAARTTQDDHPRVEEAMEDVPMAEESSPPPPLEDPSMPSPMLLCEQCNFQFARSDFNDHVARSAMPHSLEYKCQYPRCGQWFGRRPAVHDHEVKCSYNPSATASNRKRRHPGSAPQRTVSPKLVRADGSEAPPKAREKAKRTPPGAIPRVAGHGGSAGGVVSAAVNPGNQVPASMSPPPPAAQRSLFQTQLNPAAAAAGAASPAASSASSAPLAAPLLPTPIDVNAHLYSQPNAQLVSMYQKALKENHDMRALLHAPGYSALQLKVLNDIELYLINLLAELRKEKIFREGCLGAACQQRGTALHPSQPNPRAATSFPCRHLNLCMDCIQVTTNCPECQEQIIQYVERNVTPAAVPINRTHIAPASSMMVATTQLPPPSSSSSAAASAPSSARSNLLQVPSPHRPPLHPRSPPSSAGAHSSASRQQAQRTLPAAPAFRETIEVTDEDEAYAPGSGGASTSAAASPTRRKATQKNAQHTPTKLRGALAAGATQPPSRSSHSSSASASPSAVSWSHTRGSFHAESEAMARQIRADLRAAARGSPTKPSSPPKPTSPPKPASPPIAAAATATSSAAADTAVAVATAASSTIDLTSSSVAQVSASPPAPVSARVDSPVASPARASPEAVAAAAAIASGVTTVAAAAHPPPLTPHAT